MASAAAERYLSTFSPEDQQAIRAGGDVDSWYQAAVSAGAVPQNYVTGAAAVGAPQTASTRPWWEMSAQEAGINPWQQDYKQEFGLTSGSDLARMSPEQRARWSMEHIDDLSAHGDRQRAFTQWMGWQRHFDPNCPSNAPYQAEDGSGCVEKPDNTNRGYQQAAEGGGYGSGGAGQGGQYGNVSSNLTSPLIDMLKMQGSFLGQYDPIKGDNSPGVRGGAMGGGGIWWSPTQQKGATGGVDTPTVATGGVDAPARGIAKWLEPVRPNTGGIMAGQNVANTGTVTNRQVNLSPPAIQQDALTAAMMPIQGQRPFSGVSLTGNMAPNTLWPQKRQQSGLVGAMSPLQMMRRRQATSWF